MNELPILIDTRMHGSPRITGTFVVAGEKTAIVETGPKSVVDNVLAGLEASGVEHLDWIVVTHIHLDHAGAAGTLARSFPDATVAVHHVGAPHLVDPSKLWASAARIYGDDMDRLWGGIDPIPEERVRSLVDGDTIDLGGRSLRAVETTGHARHHHAYLDDATGILFAGDALGVHLPDVGLIRPATPPPEFDCDVAVASIERIRSLQPDALWFTHFGPTDTSVGETCDRAIEALRAWEAWVRQARERTDDLDEATALVLDEAQRAYEKEVEPDALARLEQTTSYRMNVWGYMRYLDKKESGAR